MTIPSRSIMLHFQINDAVSVHYNDELIGSYPVGMLSSMWRDLTIAKYIITYDYKHLTCAGFLDKRRLNSFIKHSPELMEYKIYDLHNS